jgi:Protein of unknown function (DUF2844)
MGTQIKCRKLRVGNLSRLLVVCILLGPSSLFAELGGNLDSIQADRAQMKANVTISNASAYNVHEIKSSIGTVVREYAAPDGTVFAVAWQGPFIPDMRQLLGSYFEQYSRAAKTQRETHVSRSPLNIHEDGLVVQTAGHMRAFSGRAYDPRLLPAGVSENDIR